MLTGGDYYYFNNSGVPKNYSHAKYTIEIHFGTYNKIIQDELHCHYTEY